MDVPNQLQSVICFGLFEADLRAGELRKKGVRVKLQDLPFRALTVLLSHPNEIVSREQLRQALWPPELFVDFDRGISSAIKRLCDALGDSADNPIFIQTIDRRGYRWIAPLSYPEQVAAPIVGQIARQETPNSAPPKFAWRKLIFALPLFVVLLSGWFLRSRIGMSRSHPSSVSANIAHHAANREAEDFYLKGRFYWNKRTPESLNLAVDSFTQAIVHDPNFSDAYVGLADCYDLLREYTLMPPGEAYPRAFAAAKKAVELDPSSSDAHASLAFVSFFGMWDVKSADREFRQAIELNPASANAHHWYATYLQTVRRLDESLREIDRAQALDPNSAAILADKGRLLWVAGRHDESLRLLRQLEDTDPQYVSPHRYLRFAYLANGDDVEYLAEMKKEAALLHDAPLAAIADAAQEGYANNGRRGMLESMLAAQYKAYADGRLSPFYLAETYSLLGDAPHAMEFVDICVDKHTEEILAVEVDPAFDDLHKNPAFRDAMVKIGLPSVE